MFTGSRLTTHKKATHSPFLKIKLQNPLFNHHKAEAKSASSASAVRGAARGAKGAKGSKNTAPEARAGDDTVARGKFSLEASAHSEARSSRKRSSSSFKMADAKALGRALAKGNDTGYIQYSTPHS